MSGDNGNGEYEYDNIARIMKENTAKVQEIMKKV